MLIFTKQGELDVAAVLQTAFKAAGAFPATLHLYKNEVTPNRDSVAGDFEEADFTGYAALTMTWTVGPYLNGAMQAEIQQTSHNWTPTDDVTPNTIYGWYMTETGGDLLCAQVFDTPRSMNGPTDSITLLASLIIVPGGLSGNVQPLDA